MADDEALPPGWAWARLGELIESIEAGKNVAALGRPPEAGEVGIIKVSAVTWDEFDEDESKTLPPGAEFDPAHFIAPGDFLISRANTLQLVGAPVIVRHCHRRLVLSDKVWRLRFRLDLDRWVRWFLKSMLGREQIESYAQGAQLSMRNISQDNLCRIAVPMPPASERACIVAEVESLFAELDVAEAALTRARENLAQFRASLLHAACTGALTAEWRAANPPTETGADLLRRILAERRAAWERAERARMEAKGKRLQGDDWKGRYVEPAGPNTDDLPELPDGWVWATLDQLLATMTSGSRAWAPYYDSGSSVFVMAQNVRPGRLDLSFKQAVDPPMNDPERQRTRITRNDLLLTIVGANTGDACRVDRELDDHYVCQSVALMRPVCDKTAAYLEVYLTSPEDGRAILDRLAYGAGRPHLSFEQLRGVHVPLPPLDEQARIVGVLRKSNNNGSALNDLIPEPDVAQTLRQSILHAAFTGKLVPQDPNDELATVLLARLRAAPASPRRTRRRATAEGSA